MVSGVHPSDRCIERIGRGTEKRKLSFCARKDLSVTSFAHVRREEHGSGAILSADIDLQAFGPELSLPRSPPELTPSGTPGNGRCNSSDPEALHVEAIELEDRRPHLRRRVVGLSEVSG